VNRLSAWWRRQIHPDAIQSLTTQRIFDRGLVYFQSGCVCSLQIAPKEVIANVQGSSLYQVKLWRRKGRELQTLCSCPFASEGAICKHVVAVACALHHLSTTESDVPTEKSS